MKTSQLWKACILCILIVTVIFAVIYQQFIFGGHLYAYDDIGGDSIHLSIPISEYHLNLLEQNADNTYSLQYGLGAYQEGILSKYLYPMQLPILLFGAENMNLALWVRMYICCLIMCVFGLLFFNRLFKNEKISSICALLWTFTAYSVLWAQHYSFIINTAAFTMTLYGFQLYLEEDKHWHLIIPFMAIQLAYSYYFAYMSCFFFLPYGILYLAYHKKKFSYVLKRIGIFIPVMILAACMAGAYILPAFLELFQSNRLQTNVGTGFGWIPKVHTPLVIFTFLTRLINTNLLGVGSNFYASINYYECAILSVSLLFVFAFIYMLQTKYWKRTLVISGICVIALCSPLTSQLLQFAPFSQRWTYMLSLAQVLLIGFAVSHLLTSRGEATAKKRYLITLLVTDGLILGFLAFLCLIRVRWGVPFNIAAIITVAIILLAYHVAFFFLWKTKFGYRAIVIALALELVLANYATVNDRVLVPLDTWENAYAHDGTEEVVQWIQKQDDSLYRINKTYISLSNNDSLLQGYNGMGLYYSTISSHLLNVSRSFGYTDNSSRINFTNNTIMENTMLGVKYVITQGDTEMDDSYYTQIYSDGSHSVYQNNYALGFGYLYQDRMQEADFYALPTEEATKLLSQYYYVTGSNDVPSIHSDELLHIEDSQLQTNLETLQKSCVTDLVQNGNTFAGTVDNPYTDNAMLCLPLIYSSDWVATVDGTPVAVENINAGLVGICVPNGSHTIEVTYSSNAYQMGVLCSAIGIAAYVLFLFGRKWYQKKQQIAK